MRTPRMWLAISIMVAACEVSRPSPMVYEEAEIVVHVLNENWLDVNLYAVRGTQSQRIGYLTSLEIMDIDVGPGLLDGNQLIILARPIGSNETWQSEAITVHGHTRIDLRIAPAIPESSYRVHYLDEDEDWEYTR